MNHPSTCQCGGSGKLPKECTCNCNPCGCTFYECLGGSQKIMEWEKAFRNRFGNYGLYEDQEYAGHQDVLPEVESFIRSLLASHSQQMQERHEGEIKTLSSKHKEDVRALRNALEHTPNPRKEQTYWSHQQGATFQAAYKDSKEKILEAFDSTLKERGISL